MKTYLLIRTDRKFVKFAAGGDRVDMMERQAGELILRGYILPLDKAAPAAPKPAAKPAKRKAKPAAKPAAKRKAAPRSKDKAPAKKAAGGFAERMARVPAAAAKKRK